MRQQLAARARAFVISERGLEPMCAHARRVPELLRPVAQPRAAPDRAR